MSQNFWAVEYALVADLLIRIARQPRHSKSDRKSVKRPIKTDGPNGKPWACKGRFPASGSPGNDRFFLKANTAIPRPNFEKWFPDHRHEDSARNAVYLHKKRLRFAPANLIEFKYERAIERFVISDLIIDPCSESVFLIEAA
ncbi:hypothetical protein C8J57DRAFT_1233830 [Mycena rebaudengoi]|nr:hypothetical protein C8J57DRAFT_1233830 [Mycena rebaudengoi]